MKIHLNRNWTFTENFTDEFLAGEPVPDAMSVDLPHTCRVTPYDYFDEHIYQMICGYRRKLFVPQEWAEKRIFLCLGAAAHSAEVFVNGRKLSEHHCGYTAFSTELTGALTPGQDALLTVRVNSREDQDIPPFGHVIDYMTYGGLYREAWLEIRPACFVADVFAKPELGGRLESEITLSGDPTGLYLRQRVLDGDAVLAETFAAPGETPVLSVPGAQPWEPDSPQLYTLQTALLRGEETVDQTETRIGFRSVCFREDGFYLNGKKFKLLGLNRHQSYPYVGYAMPERVQRFDADILKKELGCNFVRTSHYPQSPHFIDRCDELGLLVFTEIPGWQHIGGAAWKDQAVRNVEEMIRQYRNHPSVMLWGVRINESVDDDEFYQRTNERAHQLDPTRQTGGVRYLKKSHLLEDVYTYNDFLHDGVAPGCDPKKKVTSDPHKGYLITEFGGHMYPTKNYDSERHRFEHALRHANVLDAVRAREDIAGCCGWCMVDYNTHRDFGSGDRICYHGVMDMFRNPKLAAAVYASQQERADVLEINSSMEAGDHPASQRGRTVVFTNADAVRVYKNDRLIREFRPTETRYHHLQHPPIEIDDLIGDLIAENENFAPKQAQYVKDLINEASRFGFSRLGLKSKLKAAWLMLRYRMTFGDAYALYSKYISNTSNWGNAHASYRFEAVRGGRVVRTLEKASVQSIHLTAEASHTDLCEGATYDAALVRIVMRDQNGNVLPYYHEGVRLQAEGPIELIGPEIAQLRGGTGGTFVRTVGRGGDAALTLTAPTGESVQLKFTVSV